MIYTILYTYCGTAYWWRTLIQWVLISTHNGSSESTLCCDPSSNLTPESWLLNLTQDETSGELNLSGNFNGSVELPRSSCQNLPCWIAPWSLTPTRTAPLRSRWNAEMLIGPPVCEHLQQKCLNNHGISKHVYPMAGDIWVLLGIRHLQSISKVAH